MTPRPLQFLRRGQPVALGNVPPDRTLLEVLREDLGCTGTKEGCGEGDCGACTVVLGEAMPRQGALQRHQQLHPPGAFDRRHGAVDGGRPGRRPADPAGGGTTAPRSRSGLHPQEAMVQCHGSQCGFCTPGFVMSLFGMYQNHVCQGQPVTRALAQEELSGNLCRCTGYRPILDAAQHMATLPPRPSTKPNCYKN
jgi:xanthine dehydrogenase small subunit